MEGFIFSEGERHLASCLITTNIASYQADDYLSSYTYRAYLTQSPSILQVRLSQQENEWVLATSSVWISAGLMQVRLQFDQSMNQTGPLAVYLDPQGEGAGQGAVIIVPSSGSWSETVYPDDTWAGSVMIPENSSETWDGLAELSIFGAENFWGEPLEESRQFTLFIDTQIPNTVTNPVACFINEVATIYWDRSLETDILGYNLYGAPGGNDPLVDSPGSVE